jgi:D-glycero-D-manno-heptose 1,7-bisphosphate phosphatase
MNVTKVILLDRDGVINIDSTEYIKSPDEFIPIPGSIEAISRLNKRGFRIGVATNQSAIARGLIDFSTLDQIHHKMTEGVEKHGGKIDFIEFCPHLPSDGCKCRKPRPGMLIQLAKKFTVDLNDVYFVGDRVSDVRAALSVQAKPVFIGSNKDLAEVLNNKDILCFNNLSEFSDYICANSYSNLEK